MNDLLYQTTLPHLMQNVLSIFQVRNTDFLTTCDRVEYDPLLSSFKGWLPLAEECNSPQQ